MTDSVYTIKVETRFEAAHNLTAYYGEPEPIHGHSWCVEARLTSNNLDHEDISVDFVKIETKLKELSSRFDHNFFNIIAPFDKISPTSENIAIWFYNELNQPELLKGATLQDITVWEGPNNTLTYNPNAKINSEKSKLENSQQKS